MRVMPMDALDFFVGNYLNDDHSAERYVPFILETLLHHRLLSAKNIAPRNVSTGTEHRPSLHNWSTRVNSLLQSKVSGARWSGVCLVKVSVEQSDELFLQHAYTWCSMLLGLLTVRSLVMIF